MSAETDAWRVAETRRVVKDFLDLFYDDNRSDEEKRNLAIFTLGTLSTVVLMSDEAVKKKMTDPDGQDYHAGACDDHADHHTPSRDLDA